MCFVEESVVYLAKTKQVKSGEKTLITIIYLNDLPCDMHPHHVVCN